MGQPEVLQRADPRAAEIGGEEVRLLDHEPRLQNQFALPRVAIRLEELLANGFAQVGKLGIGDLPCWSQLRDLGA
jgi:hypothetical protein